MKKGDRQLLRISEIAFKNITILLLCVLMGIGIDKRFDTKPLWIIIFSLVGLFYVITSIILLGSNKNEL